MLGMILSAVVFYFVWRGLDKLMLKRKAKALTKLSAPSVLYIPSEELDARCSDELDK